ncbi:MAG: hypothetical protein M1550_06610 [Deltaproteobacteria bacterium]|nr:hypothetical protein [Deltaproteobacteria bacterium]
MKRLAILLLAIIFLGFAQQVSAAGPLGPPQGFADDDRWVSVGAGYFWFETKWEPKDKAAFPSDVTMGQNIAFSHAGNILFEAGEGFLRLGAADLQQTDGAFEADYQAMATIGLKGLWFGETGRRARSAFGFGPILQGSYYLKFEEDRTPLGSLGTADVKIENFWDATLALGLQYRLNEKFLAFGGPFGYFSQAKVKMVTSVPSELSTKLTPL